MCRGAQPWIPTGDGGGGGGRRRDVTFINIKKPRETAFFSLQNLTSGCWFSNHPRLERSLAPSGTNRGCPQGVPDPRDSFAREKGALEEPKFAEAAFGVKREKKGAARDSRGSLEQREEIPKEIPGEFQVCAGGGGGDTQDCHLSRFLPQFPRPSPLLKTLQ